MTVLTEVDVVRSALAGRYTVDRELGRGGMGVVLLARDLALDRPVAIKLLPPTLAAQSDLRERFLREVRTAASLSHPNIVPIYSVEETDGLVFYVMGYIDGETLTQRVRRTGPLAPGDAAKILQECAWGLGYAHGRGIVHRDVKADNILLERASGRAYITDFGIARAANAVTMTAIGETLGTPQYMSPEQAAGEALNGRSDIYSLGVAAYFALTGSLPFDGPSVQSILAMHITKPAAPVGTVRSGLPPKLAAAVDRCLAKEADSRFATGEALVTAIQDAQVARAEIPPPVRMFQRMADMGMTQLVSMTLILLVLYTDAKSIQYMLPLMWVTMLVVLVAQLRTRARALLGQGFGYDDVALAFAQEARERREAVAATARAGPQRLSNASRLGVVLGVLTAAAGLIIGVPSAAGTWERTLGKLMLPIGIFTAILSGATVLLRGGGARRGTLLASRLWLSPFGPAFFRSAAAGLVRDPTTAAVPGATSQSLSTMIAALAPKERRELGEVHRVIVRIEQRLRTIAQREEQIDVAASDAVSALANAASADGRAGHETLMGELDAVRAKLANERGALVGLLDEFRLSVIRVRAGIANGATLGPSLAAAQRLLAESE